MVVLWVYWSLEATNWIGAKIIRLHFGHATTQVAANAASSITFVALPDYNADDGFFASTTTLSATSGSLTVAFGT